MKTYSNSLLLGILTVLLLVAGFNWRVNPFNVFSVPDIEGFNLAKAEADRRGRLSKIYQVNRIKPDYIILGSSRALEIPADYSGSSGLSGFNLALASGSSYELLRLFQHAQAVRNITRVVIGLDESFSNDVQPNFLEERLAVTVTGLPHTGLWLAQWKDRFSSLLSFDALRASLSTIRKQPAGEPGVYKLRAKKARVKNAGGHRQMFRTMESTVMAGYAGQPQNCDAVSVTDIDHDRLMTSSFRRMLETAYENDVDFHIFFSPLHARLYEARCLIGDWPAIENTRRAVVQLVHELASQYGKAPFHVWDFSGYNSVTTESLPEAGDVDSLMRWYWEGSHYSEETAKLILDRMFDSGDVPDDFGVLLDTENIEQHFSSIHQQRMEYVSSHAQDVDEVRALLLRKNGSAMP